MAEPKEKGAGLLAILGGPPKGEGDSEGKPSTPKGRAMKAMWEALQDGDFEEAGHQYEAAYDICAMKSDEDYEEPEPLADEE